MVPGPGQERLDILLVDRGLAPSRVKARALVLAGQVLSNGQRLDKPGTRLRRDAPLEVLQGRRWVSRGGDKLEPVLDRLGVDPAGREAMDVGSSTGGFTHVLLEKGATRVLAVDVGRGQLDWTLRNDERVHVMEGVNARHLTPDRLPWRPSLAVVDVSFISLRLVLPAVVACLLRGEIVALVKPQFEAGRGRVGRGGIVRDGSLCREILRDIAGWSSVSGWGVRELCAAALRGAHGNQEYFLHIVPGQTGLDESALERRVDEVVLEDEA